MHGLCPVGRHARPTARGVYRLFAGLRPCAMVFSLRLIPSAFLHVPSYKSAVTVMLRWPSASISRVMAALKALLFWCGDAHFSSMPLETLPVTRSSSLGRRAQRHLIQKEEICFPKSQTASPSGICERRRAGSSRLLPQYKQCLPATDMRPLSRWYAAQIACGATPQWADFPFPRKCRLTAKRPSPFYTTKPRMGRDSRELAVTRQTTVFPTRAVRHEYNDARNRRA